MVCIAAFIILCLVGIFVAFLSIFRRDIGKKYWTIFKKAWGCVGKKVRLQKCETNFKDDVKNSLLSKIVLKHPTWVKPLGVAIEVSAILIVFITIWSLVEAVKALLALWVFGTCNVSQPASCALGAEVCGIDAAEPTNPFEWAGRWFSEWGEIFVNIPDRFRSWQAEDFAIDPAVYATKPADGRTVALDIFDPGCTICMQSYRNQKSTGFFGEYNTLLMVYPIELPDGGYKFQNSDVFARYFYATSLYDTSYASQLVDRLFTESNDKGINFQSVLMSLSETDTQKLMQSWLKDFGMSEKNVSQVIGTTYGEKVDAIIAEVKDIVENRIHAKGIPTLIYNGKKHSGLYEAE